MPRTVAQIMTADPPVLQAGDSVERVVELLHEHRVRGVAVVDADQRLVGVVTENDLLMAGEEEDLDPPANIQIFGGVIFLGSVKHWEERVKKAIASTVGDVMSADPVAVGPDATAADAGHLIADSGHNLLPVVDAERRLVGIVTRADVLSAVLADR